MKTLAHVIFGMLVALSIVRADWSTLKQSDGQVVEVAVDFDIEEYSANPNGDILMTLATTHDGKRVGMMAEFSKPREGEIRTSKKQRLVIMRTGVALTSIGEPSETLEKCVRMQIDPSKEVEHPPMRILGLYSGSSLCQTMPLFSLCIIHASSVGITFDEKGEKTTGEGYNINFVVDIPMKKLRAYFSCRGGYGGISVADKAREQVLKEATTASQQ